MRRLLRAFFIAGICVLSLPALASEEGGAAHHDPVAMVVLWLAVILAAAKLGGDLAVRVGQPPVLGELLAGVVLGNLHFFGIGVFEIMKEDDTVDMLARLGVIILLFEVGLESTVAQMLKVGASAFLVATIGVIVPMCLGFVVGEVLLSDHSVYVHLFLGATLCATSVGITARVFKDLGVTDRKESQIVLGAAVIDDVLGLVVLAVVVGIIAAADAGSSVSIGASAFILFKALAFLVGSLVLGVIFSKRLFNIASKLRARGVLLATGLSICFVFAWAADAVGLAPIVGAFAAGLILEEVHYRDFMTKQGEHGLEELIHPIASMLVPIFFVMMGMRTDLAAFANTQVLGLAALLTIAAFVGKQACGLGALGRGLDRVTIGVGMVPRGEVGLIFANIGLTLQIQGQPIITPNVFSAVVVMVIVTTIVTPPLLRWSLKRNAVQQPGV
jgi:Kef-type K+ transport system membrane component KefB